MVVTGWSRDCNIKSYARQRTKRDRNTSVWFFDKAIYTSNFSLERGRETFFLLNQHLVTFERSSEGSKIDWRKRKRWGKGFPQKWTSLSPEKEKQRCFRNESYKYRHVFLSSLKLLSPVEYNVEKIQQNVKWSSSKGSITRERRVRRQNKEQGKAYRKTEKAKDKWRGFLILPFLSFLVHRLLLHRVLLSSSCRSLLHCFTCLSYWRFFPWMTMSWMLFFSAVLLQVLVVETLSFLLPSSFHGSSSSSSSLSSLEQDVNPSP